MSRAPDSGDAAAALDVLDFAIGVLVREPDPRAQVAAAAIGAVITGEAVDLFAYIANADNLPGHSLREDATLARRNRLLCQLGEGITATELAKELRVYAAGYWARRDSVLSVCPYAEGDRRRSLWAILKLRAHVVGESQIRRLKRASTPF
jgi:hypothetical protein